MKYFFLFFILVFAGCSKVDDLKGFNDAISLGIKGKNGHFTCLEFAEDLYSKLRQSGVAANIVIFSYQVGNNVYGHACVFYEDTDGRLYIMDNRMLKPKWVKKTTAQQMLEETFSDLPNIKIIKHIP